MPFRLCRRCNTLTYTLGWQNFTHRLCRKYGFFAPTPTPLSHTQNFLLKQLWICLFLKFNIEEKTILIVHAHFFLFVKVNILWKFIRILSLFALSFSIETQTQCHLVVLFSIVYNFIYTFIPYWSISFLLSPEKELL